MNSKLETLKKKVALAWDASVFGPVCLLENSFFLESEFRESIFRYLVV
jgi:hypothetical protein